MSKTTYERGETLVYPNHYPTLTFTPIFGHRGDFMWIEEVKAAWPEHDSEFTFVRSTMHDERVDALKAENEELRDTMSQMAYDHAEQTRKIRALRVENEQMRKLLDFCSEYIADDRCEGCVLKHPCYEGDIDDCWMKVQLMRMMNDLGIEVR